MAHLQLAWPDESTKHKAWVGFEADEERNAIKRTTDAKHSALVGAIENRVLVASNYSPTVPKEF